MAVHFPDLLLIYNIGLLDPVKLSGQLFGKRVQGLVGQVFMPFGGKDIDIFVLRFQVSDLFKPQQDDSVTGFYRQCRGLGGCLELPDNILQTFQVQ